MKKASSETEGKHFQGGSRSEAAKIILESQRKGRVLADQLREEIIMENYIKKLEASKMSESGRPDTTGFVKANPPVENKIQEQSNIWQWFNMPEADRVALAETIEKKLFGGIFEKGFEKVQHLERVLEQNNWLPDLENKLLRFQERCEELLSASSLWARKDYGKEEFRKPLWLETVKERFEEMTKLLRWSPFAQENEGPSPDPEKGFLRFQERCEELLSNSKAWSSEHLGEDDFRGPLWLQTIKNRFEEMGKWVNWSPFDHKPEGESPAMMSKRNDKESPLTTKEEAGLEPNSVWFRMLSPFAPTPEEAPKPAQSPFSAGDITRKDYGALFGFGNINSYFGQAEGDLAKSVSKLGKRHKEETRIEMDGLKEEIKNIKSNEDKMMQSLEDLKEETKRIDTASKEGKSRSVIEADLPEDEIMTAVKRGFEPII